MGINDHGGGKKDKITQVLSINDPKWKYYLWETLRTILVKWATVKCWRYESLIKSLQNIIHAIECQPKLWLISHIPAMDGSLQGFEFPATS